MNIGTRMSEKIVEAFLSESHETFHTLNLKSMMSPSFTV